MLETIKNFVWSAPVVINLALFGVAVLIKTKGYTFFRLPSILKDTVFKIKKSRKSFAMMCTSLGGTIGVGNAIGVAGALTEGGAGAVFWMGIAGILGMAIKYAEIFLALTYKTPGIKSYGPMAYIEKGTGTKFFAVIYAFLCVCVSLGMGNLAQVKSAISAFDGIFSIPEFVLSGIIVIVFFRVVIGGIKKISSFSEIAVPVISLVYIFSLLFVLFKFRENVPNAIRGILSGTGLMTGVKWAVIKKGITSGFSKAIFSSEAGLGSVGFAHTSSDTDPHEQGKWGVVEVFVDAVICIMTSIAILTLSKEISGVPTSYMTRAVFAYSMGVWGEIFYGVSMTLFAFASLLCWFYNGSTAVEYITKKKSVSNFYCLLFGVIIFASAFIKDCVIIDLSDIANGVMMTMNLCCLWLILFKNTLTFNL
ncbi:MAG: sodium:alanine symporter family protein [Ruminococcaceae bacterium]|nr:sodium:alanine symporter family protein [Oscillospiraceae bacterium]